jgi:uncharacterized protein DUF5666
MRKRVSFFVAMTVLATACVDMSSPSTPSSSTTTSTQSSPVPGRDNSNNNPGPSPTPTPNPNPTPGPNPNPNQPGRVELKGIIAGRTGACPSITFSVGTSTVMTNAATTFDDGACSTLQNGVQVEVEGVRQANDVVLASRVENKTADDDEDDNDDDDRHGGEARLEGSIAGLGGACPSLTFSVSGSTVSTSASTRFDDACSSLKNGDRVEVRGVRQTNNVVAASRVEKKK